MKRIIVLLACVAALSSCTSEYQERLEMAKEIKVKIDKTSDKLSYLGKSGHLEIEEMKAQILFHAKVSGNESLFIEQVYEH